MHVKTSTTPVNKSGCNIMSAKTNITIINGQRNPFLNNDIYTLYLIAYQLKYSNNPNFINSDGCILNAPTPIQHCAPPRTSPMPGTKTRSKSVKQRKKIRYT